jgi:hypothetical protein
VRRLRRREIPAIGALIGPFAAATRARQHNEEQPQLMRNISYAREVSCPRIFCQMFLEVAIGSVEHSERATCSAPGRCVYFFLS